ncbi:hypothetical protein HBH56_091590 [Parastagonospora nodorum]|nr:hypothetical protein HBH56_091590 [Parastagonospora nodorum]KAH3936128.1 hypothetical protein HBH54_026230 [Parastagonospora nodorum]KAH4034401.1 hypothetical protein HBI09_110090 [Parastagonospora nodorum]KAH4145150.1 hypothetical protein HBH45_016720 [Parastagonospora nodorum]KAH4162390.1 hypothetical protein HBH44_089090 [Parastagonospora nodorum]
MISLGKPLNPDEQKYVYKRSRCTCKRRKRRKRMVSKCGISIPFSLGYPHINGGAPSSSFGQSKQGNPGTVSLISRELQSVFTWLIILLHSHNF